jgi:hypothetical protein
MKIKNINSLKKISILLIIFVTIIFLMFEFGENKLMRILIGGGMGIFFMLWFDYVTKQK